MRLTKRFLLKSRSVSPGMILNLSGEKASLNTNAFHVITCRHIRTTYLLLNLLLKEDFSAFDLKDDELAGLRKKILRSQ